jgi:nucleotide-binding universal stress UspA family protein
MSSIVVGYDGSECGRAALAEAIGLARALGDRLVIVYAAEPPGRSVGDEWQQHRAALEEIGGRLLAEAAAQAEAAGVAVQPVVVIERPVPALLDTAEREAARLIVVGTTSERPLTGVILGAVPHKLVHRAERPVLVVPIPAEVHA